MSLGIGLGAFMQGMGQGIGLGQSIGDMRDRARTREAAQGAFRQSQKEREVAIDRVMSGGQPQGDEPAPGGTAPVAQVQQQPLASPGVALGLPPQATPAAPPRPRLDVDALAEDDAAFQRQHQQRRTGDAFAPRLRTSVPGVPQAVVDGGNTRAALDPNSPDYPQQIMRENDHVVAQTMGGARPPRPAAALGITPPSSAPAAAPAATQGLPPLPAAAGQARQPVSRAEAERQIGSAVDFYTRNHAPRVVEHFLANGDVDSARRFQSWLREEQTQRGMRDFGGMMRAAQMGDAREFGRRFQSLSENDGYNHSGFRVTGTRAIQGEGGITGMEVTLRGRDGEETTQRFTDMTQLYRLGLSHANPTQMFQHISAEFNAARAAATTAELEDRRDRRLEARTIRAEGRANAENDRRTGRDQQAQVERDNNQSWNRRLEAIARARGERVSDIQQRLETIRNNLASADMGGPFSRLSPTQQMEKAMEILQQGRDAAGRILGQQGATGVPAATLPAWRPGAVR